MSPEHRVRELSWSPATGFPISSYNANVHPRFKILFEHI